MGPQHCYETSMGEGVATDPFRIIHSRGHDAHPYNAMVTAIQILMTKNWNIKISHCFREANMVANRMARHAHGLRGSLENMEIFGQPPTFCRNQLAGDDRGVCFPRICMS